MDTTAPSRKEYTNYGIGTAMGIIFTWGLSFFVDVPGEIGVAFGSFFVWLAWRFKLGKDE